MTASRNLTPLILTGFFAAILLTLVAASAWSHDQLTQAAKDGSAQAYDVPEDADQPVTDAVIEKAAA